MTPNGLELSRLASPDLVSHQNQTPGWPGRLQRVVRLPRGLFPLESKGLSKVMEVEPPPCVELL
jgi:hypothetical protein